MKRIIISASLAALAMLAGCNKDEIKTVKSEHSVNILIGNVQTRTLTNTSDLTTTFKEGDKLGIFSDGLYAEMNNTEFVVPATSGDPLTTTEGDFYYAENKDQAVFHAYYPKGDNAAVSGSEVVFTVSDQNGEDLFNANDFMTTANGGVTGSAGSEVTLTFQHQLSLVKVIWSETNEPVAHVTINDIKPTANWDYSNGTVTTSGDAISIKMWQIQNGGQEFWALIPAQTASSGRVLFTVTTEANATYQYTPASNIEFTSNKVKTFTLAKAESGSTTLVAVSAVAGNIGNWDNTDNSDNGGNVEKVLETLISAKDGNFANVTLNETSVTGFSSIKNAGWTKVINADSDANFTINNEELEMTNGTTGSWYKCAIAYRNTSPATVGQYILKFQAKSDLASSQFYCGVLIPEQNNTFFKLNNATYLYTATLQTDWTSFELPVDLSVAGTNSSTPAEADVSKGILLVFANKDNSSTTYIKNVSLIEKE